AGVGCPVAFAVASLIERDHVEPVDERRHHRIEPVGVGGPSVEEAEGRATGLPPLERTKSHSIDSECTASCCVTDERGASSHARQCSAKKKLGLLARTSYFGDENESRPGQQREEAAADPLGRSDRSLRRPCHHGMDGALTIRPPPSPARCRI